MSYVEIILLAISLATDAFAVAVAKGHCVGPDEQYKKFVLPALFGLFQMLMPIMGWLLGAQFIAAIKDYDHWVIFFLLGYLGVTMIREGINHSQKIQEGDMCPILSAQEMILLAVATSIDALAIGITFAFFEMNVISASMLIGILTFFITLIGIFISDGVGRLLKDKAEIVGGVVLIFIGLKILLEHLGFIA